jgi:hypothetical protein
MLGSSPRVGGFIRNGIQGGFVQSLVSPPVASSPSLRKHSETALVQMDISPERGRCNAIGFKPLYSRIESNAYPFVAYQPCN